MIYTEINNYKFLFMGDAGTKVEKEILNKYNLNNIDFLKIGHHGSSTSTNKNFVDNLNPKYSLISVGKHNMYGHPKDSVLEVLSKSQIYRTDLDGSVVFSLNNDKLGIRRYLP